MPRIYAAMDDALVVVDATADGGWSAETALAGRSIECVAAHPSTPERAIVGTFESGLHLTRDSGDTWYRVGSDRLASASVTAVAVDHADPAIWWAGTEPSAVYRSTDGGETWTATADLTTLPSADRWSFPPRPHTHHVRWIEPDPADGERLYVGIEAGALVITDDAGASWGDRPRGSRRDNHSLATHPDAPGRVYAAAGDGYAESTDGGETWAHPQTGLDHRYCWSVVPDPADPDRVLLSAASGPRTAHSPPGESYVYRRNGELPWERAMTGLPAPEGLLRAVLAPATAPGNVIALSNHGLYQTADFGDTWEPIPVEWPERFKRAPPRGLVVV